MANARKLAQLSSMFAGMGQSAATYNPAQKSMLDNLQGSAQSAIAAEAQKEAARIAGISEAEYAKQVLELRKQKALGNYGGGQ